MRLKKYSDNITIYRFNKNINLLKEIRYGFSFKQNKKNALTIIYYNVHVGAGNAIDGR
jgi:hypothetical protein